MVANRLVHQGPPLAAPWDSDAMCILLSKSMFVAILGLMATAARRKTSFEVDFDKVDAARDILGTKSLTDTVDAALEEVVKLRDRQRLVDLLFEPGALELGESDVMAHAWR